MKTLDCILSRRSIRSYHSGKQVSSADLESILQAGLNAPSAMNKQPWEFVVITDQKILENITQIHPYAAFLPDAGCGIIVCVNTQKQYENYGTTDVALAAQNIMLAATDLGYGTCYCGISSSKSRIAAFQDLCKIPVFVIPTGIIALGVPAQKQEKVNRENPKALHYNTW